MKKNLILLAAVGGMLMAASESKAQEVVVADQTTVELTNVECKNYYSNSWHNNWFLQLGAGAHVPFVEGTRFHKDNWNKDISAVYNLGVGHWFSPYFGFRFTAFYSNAIWHLDGLRGSSRNGNLNLDLMWDMISSIRGWNENRVFSLIPFIGVGGTFSWDYNHHDGDAAPCNVFNRHGNEKNNVWSLPVSAGIQLRFRLCKYVDFFAEGRFMFYTDEWNRVATARPIDIDASVIGGFNINFGGRHFESYNPCDYLDYIAALNGQVNDLRGALAATAAALAACEAQLPCPEVTPCPPCNDKPAPMLSCVRFRINSAVVSELEMVNVYNVAEWMKANPEAKVTLRGYADKDTGTAAYNQKLSQRRAQAVKDLLVNKYGIAADRLTCEDFGSSVQPYDVNNWNRIVIFAE